jgi:hypothetical protein
LLFLHDDLAVRPPEDRKPSFNEENRSWPLCDQRGVREGQV